MAVFLYIVYFLAAQCVILSVAAPLVRCYLRNAAARNDSSNSAEKARSARANELHGLLSNVTRVLVEHAKELGRFERSLETPPSSEPTEKNPKFDDRLREVHHANQRVDRAFDTISNRLAGTKGDLLEDRHLDLDAYRGKTASFDQALENLSQEELLSGIAARLLDMVHDLRQENVNLAQEAIAAKTQLIEQVSRTYAAEQVARTDLLTQLPNRRAFEEAHSQFQANLERHGQGYCLVLFDVDHFKSVNDQHGHAAGDALLSMVGRVFRETQRATDYASRVGGEEFGMLLPRCDERTGRLVADRYRQKLETATLDFRGKKLAITISGGVTEATADDDLGRLLERADAALYAAKSQGRNRICTNGDVVLEHRADDQDAVCVAQAT